MNRLRAACWSNEPQLTAVCMMTMLNLAACQSQASWQVWLIAAVFWPMLAFVFNLISPIPKDDHA